jgi:MFS family permease
MGMAWAISLIVFALTRSYVVAVAALFAAGLLNLAFTALAQTIVQLEAPPERRGRVIGLFSMAALGLRTGGGLTVGLLGTAVGIHASLGWSATGVLLACGGLLLFMSRGTST